MNSEFILWNFARDSEMEFHEKRSRLTTLSGLTAKSFRFTRSEGLLLNTKWEALLLENQDYEYVFYPCYEAELRNQ